jgi:hypothetical protein
MLKGGMCGVASLVLGCSYPALPPVGEGASTDAPAGGGTAANGPHVTLDWEVGLPAPAAPSFAPISPAPKIRIAPLGAGDASTTLAAFTDATYNADGTIAIPADYLNHPWRLEYTLADGIVHEVQWQPDAQVGHIVIPIFGRPARTPIPAGTGYTIKPTGGPGGYTFPRVFTTGLWSAGPVPAPLPAGTTIDYDFANAKSLSGDLGTPDPALGDHAFVVDYVVDSHTSCRLATGGAAFDPTVHAGVHTAVMPAWDLTPKSFQPGTNDVSRLSTISDLINGAVDSTSSMVMIGVMPTTAVTGLFDSTGRLHRGIMPVPVVIELAECPFNTAGTLNAQFPSAFLDLPMIANVQLLGDRQVLGASLLSGLENIVQLDGQGGYVSTFPAPLATQISLTAPDIKVALDGASDQVAVGTVHGTFSLDFTPESGAGIRGDYYDIILRHFTQNGLVTDRIYTVTSPSVKIDSALLTANTDYAFEIRAIKGHPQAPHGDFAPIDFPYGQTTLSPRTFKTQ